jgi:hypothetical protein
MGFGKTKRRQARTSALGESRSRVREAAGEVGTEDTAHFISETVESLARLARRHDLDLLSYLLAMTRLEAEEQVKRLRRRKLS